MNKLRDWAIETARACAKAKPQSYYSEPFQPHEWVIDAVLMAAEKSGIKQKQIEAAEQVVDAIQDRLNEIKSELSKAFFEREPPDDEYNPDNDPKNDSAAETDKPMSGR